MIFYDITDTDINNINNLYYGSVPDYSSEHKALFVPGTHFSIWSKSKKAELIQNLTFFRHYYNNDIYKPTPMLIPLAKYSLFFGQQYAYVTQFIGYSLGAARAILIALIAYKISNQPKSILLLDGPDLKDFIYNMINFEFIYNNKKYIITNDDINTFLAKSRIMKLSLYSNIINSINRKTYLIKPFLYIKKKNRSTLQRLFHKSIPIFISHNKARIYNTFLNNDFYEKTRYISQDLFEEFYDLITKNHNIRQILVNCPFIISNLDKFTNYKDNLHIRTMYYVLIYNNSIYCLKKSALRKYKEYFSVLDIIRPKY